MDISCDGEAINWQSVIGDGGVVCRLYEDFSTALGEGFPYSSSRFVTSSVRRVLSVLSAEKVLDVDSYVPRSLYCCDRHRRHSR